jgi:hypothetical protein
MRWARFFDMARVWAYPHSTSFLVRLGVRWTATALLDARLRRGQSGELLAQIQPARAVRDRRPTRPPQRRRTRGSPQAASNGIASTAAATANSTPPCTGSSITQARYHSAARASPRRKRPAEGTGGTEIPRLDPRWLPADVRGFPGRGPCPCRGGSGWSDGRHAPGFSGRRAVPVSLRSHDGLRHFIAECEVQFVEGVPGGLVHDGRRLAFSHTLPTTWSASSAPNDEIYVFDESLFLTGPLG